MRSPEHGNVDALGEAQPRRLRCGRRTCSRRGAVRHPAGRARRRSAQGKRAGADARSASMAMQSAGLRWARGRRRCSPRSISRPDNCRRMRPRYLMGVGKPDDLVGAVERGVDMFDCVLPTRSGRNGQAFTWDGPLNLRNAKHAEETDPLDSAAHARPARTYSRAYLHHLIKAGEILGRDADDGAQSLLLPAADAGNARCDRGRAPVRLCRRLPAGLSQSLIRTGRPLPEPYPDS